MKYQNVLLIIDAQYDFCNPKGSLFVDGADADMKRLSDWIRTNKADIDHIAITMDSHPVNDISHPSFWQDSNGKFPNPYTPISLQDIKEGRWVPRFFANEAIHYIESLENQGEFGHFIWPYHCLSGSRGAAIDENIMDALIEWARDGKFYDVITKGTCPLTEHFGVFRANIPIADRPETQLNQKLINTLDRFQHIYLAGEAKSHCIANSLKQVMEVAPLLAQKFIILYDCMSDVAGLGHLGAPIFEKARKMGVPFIQTTDQLL
ncbi:MAG TPA: hypothetical protein PLB87_03925 [Prolixibacteraceae bacterium]|nr:hypothetical protein [Prolixibacteraceae bacterium]